MITDSQRIAQLEQKVESLDRRVTDLRRSVATLNALIDDPTIPPQQVVIPTELIVRASCGAQLVTQGEKIE